MAVLKSYTCSKCAGILIFDTDQEFFDCPFCGTRFSSIDFHGKEMLSQADTCLERREFTVAKAKYKAILAENTCSFDALRGMLLSTIGVSSEKELSDTGSLRRTNLDSVRSELDNVRVFSGKLNAKYFNTISQMVDCVEELVQIEKIRDEMESETSKKLSSDISENLKNSSGKFFTPSMIRIMVYFGIYVICHIAFIIIFHGDPVAILFSLGHISFFFGPLVFFAIAARKSVAQSHKDLEKLAYDIELKKRDIDSKIEELEDDYAFEYKKLTGLEPETEGDTDYGVSVPVSDDTGSHKLSMKNVQCAKCGAALSLDTEKRVYECGSCGVAYGISLFFGLPHEKALNSMNMGFFTEADKRFSHILMVEPSDFESLLGRILCAGRWTKVSDICVSDDLTLTRIRYARGGLLKAVSDSKEQDKPYFECLKEYIEALGALAANRHKQRIINKELDVVQTKISVYSDLVDMYEVTRVEREYIMSRLTPFKEEEPSLQTVYDTARSKLLSMARDSVLTK
jgi:DNA-directed RNA polymerase subunit RPC12/RpoP